MRGQFIDQPVYIVLDIPSPMAEKIRELRKKFDPERSMLPAEITLTGSCGTGLISQGESLKNITCHLEKAAKKLRPFQVSFDGVDRFPGTDIYFLTLKDSPELLRTQKIISECGIRFDPTPYPYHPHCTLSLRKPPEDEQKLFDLLFLDIPSEPFTLDMISVYELHEKNSCDLLYKLPLSDSAPACI